MSESAYDGAVLSMRALGIPQDKAEREARKLYPAIPTPALPRYAREAEHTAAGDRIMLSLGFAVVRLEQRRASKIHLGVPDRRYYHTRRRLALWWESKSATGEQRPAQRDFQQLCDAVGDPYVLGPVSALQAWLVAHGVVTIDAGGGLEPVPYEGAPCPA